MPNDAGSSPPPESNVDEGLRGARENAANAFGDDQVQSLPVPNGSGNAPQPLPAGVDHFDALFGEVPVAPPVPLAARPDVNEAILDEAALINTFTIRNDALDPGIDGEDIQTVREALTILEALGRSDPSGALTQALDAAPAEWARAAVDLARFYSDPNDIVQALRGDPPPLDIPPGGLNFSRLTGDVAGLGNLVTKPSNAARKLFFAFAGELIDDLIPPDPDEPIIS